MIKIKTSRLVKKNKHRLNFGIIKMQLFLSDKEYKTFKIFKFKTRINIKHFILIDKNYLNSTIFFNF